MKKLIYMVLFIATVTLINGCEGPAGDVGPQGYKGSDGEAGQDGISGEDGADGMDAMNDFTKQEYEEALEYGGIKVVVEGIQPDDAPFKDSIEFNFNNAPEKMWASYLETTGNGYFFYLNRDYKMAVYDRKSRMVSIDDLELAFYDIYGELQFDYVSFSGNVLTSDYKTFEIDMPDDVSEYIEEVSEYYFNSVTGEIKLKIDLLIPDIMNSTGNELSMTIYVNAIVLETDMFYGP